MTVESDALPIALDSLGVLVIKLGPDGTVVACNESAVDVLGLAASSILGRHHQTLFGSLDVPRPCIVERIFLRPDGEACKIRWSINPEFDSMGMPNGISCVGVEVSPTSMTMAVAEVPSRPVDEGFVLIDGDGRIERMNRATAQMFGVDGQASVGVQSMDSIPDDLRRENGGEFESFPGKHPDPPMKGVVGLRTEGLDFALKLHVEAADLEEGSRYQIAGVAAAAPPTAPHQVRHLNALKAVLKATGVSSPVELTRSVLPRIAEQVAAQAAAVTFDVDGEQFVEFFGLPPETAGMVLDLLTRNDFNPAPLRALTRMHVIASIPLQGAHGRFGNVLLFSRHETELDADRIDTLETLTRSFAVALENVVVIRQIESVRASRDSAHESILRAMVAALELRDQETEGHTQRVTRISLQLGESLGLQGDELRNLEHGALLHDVGKIGIPDAILHKPGPLSAAEWEVMRKHPQYAYDILSPLPHLAHALDVPYCHHERYDGSGYPRGLEGSDIPLSARIFAVVDVYDAMTTERPYRPALPEDYAIAHLRSHSGTHFDPVVVEAFTLLIEKISTDEPVH
jgi:PAS domain-containing protein